MTKLRVDTAEQLYRELIGLGITGYAAMERIREYGENQKDKDLLNDCRWAMSMLVNGIEGRLMDIYDNDLEKVEKASRRMPAFRRAVLWLDAHRETVPQTMEAP
jgi:hypothetical protein